MANPNTMPADVVNRALDLIGCPAIAEMSEGSVPARAATRNYGPTVRDLLRSAPWNFARKTVTMDLMFSALNGDPVPIPWIFEYQYPQDCVKVRFVPALTTPPPGLVPPLMTNMSPVLPTVSTSRPAPFVIATDHELNVILTNVQDAMLVYTAAIFNPELWDALFMEGVVTLLAAKLAMPCVDDKKLALAMRQQQTAAAKDVVGEARATNGNEAWSTADHYPDWLRIRGAGGWPWGFFTANIPGGGLGFCGYDSLWWPDGSAY